MTARQAKRIGRRVTLRADWEDVKDSIMYNICYDKFTRNPDLTNLLLRTKGFSLIEGNTWGDRYWGVDSKTGIGENKLGHILEQIRHELLKRESII